MGILSFLPADKPRLRTVNGTTYRTFIYPPLRINILSVTDARKVKSDDLPALRAPLIKAQCFRDNRSLLVEIELRLFHLRCRFVIHIIIMITRRRFFPDLDLEPPPGFEPGTFALRKHCSTS